MDKLAGFLTAALGSEPVRYIYREDASEIFLYHALEEMVWNALSQTKNVSKLTTEEVEALVEGILAINPKLGWVPLDEAILEYQFVPCGFERAPVYCDDEKLIGHTVITSGGGLAYPEVISSQSDWVSLISYLLGCKSCKPRSNAPLNSDRGYILLPGSKPKIRWVQIKNSQLVPISAVTSFRKPRELAVRGLRDAPPWADDYFLELEPMLHWDEGEPEIASLIRKSTSDLIPTYSDQFQEVQVAYSVKASPFEICRQWLELSKTLATSVQNVDMSQLIARAIALPTLPSSGSRLEDLFAVTEVYGEEGFSLEIKRVSTAEGRKRLEVREQQMGIAREKYPQLGSFSTQCLTYWWRRYVQDTECETADVAYDRKFSAIHRDFDPDFIYYMTLMSTLNFGNLGYIFLHKNVDLTSVMFSSLGMDEHSKQRIKGAVLMLAFITDDQDVEDIPEIINDWRTHIMRLVDVAVARAAVSSFCLQYSTKGPWLFSPHDEVYCQQRNITMSYRLPRK